MVRPALRVHDRQPRFMRRVESQGRDPRQPARLGFLAIFPVHFQQVRYGWLPLRHTRTYRNRGRSGRHGYGPAAEATRKRLADASDALGPHALHAAQPAVVRRGFQLL